MKSERNNQTATGWFQADSVAFTNSNIVDPATTNVWKIETIDSGKTIFNEVITKYVGWSSGNSASIEDVASNTSTWTFTYTDDKFTVNNVATPARQLSYNQEFPRFAAYQNANQQELQFYKLEETASIVENNIEGLKVYPNPATDLVNIVSNEIGTKTVAIYDMLGKKVLETSTEEIVNVSTLTSGVYIMNITQDGKKASRKLVIK